jgi:hypothetical protein
VTSLTAEFVQIFHGMLEVLALKKRISSPCLLVYHQTKALQVHSGHDCISVFPYSQNAFFDVF